MTIKSEAEKTIKHLLVLEGITRHVNSGYLCVYERVANLKSIKDADFECFKIKQTGCSGIDLFSRYAMFRYALRDILAKAIDIA